MAFWVYILRCSDGRYYTGRTDDLGRRVSEHDHGGFCAFTSTRRPLSLVWQEQFPTRLEALEAERKIGRWSRAKKEALIRGDWGAVSFLARPPRERFSTSLETNGGEGQTRPQDSSSNSTPFVSSEVETPTAAAPIPSSSSEVEAPSTAPIPFVSSEVETRSSK